MPHQRKPSVSHALPQIEDTPSTARARLLDLANRIAWNGFAIESIGAITPDCSFLKNECSDSHTAAPLEIVGSEEKTRYSRPMRRQWK